MIEFWVSSGAFISWPGLNRWDGAGVYAAYQMSSFYDSHGDLVCRCPNLYLN